jgi:hypothetical protein
MRGLSWRQYFHMQSLLLALGPASTHLVFQSEFGQLVRSVQLFPTLMSLDFISGSGTAIFGATVDSRTRFSSPLYLQPWL